MASILGLHSLTKSFGSQILFKGITFTINQEDRIGLLGPNGAGKSSLLKILIGHDQPNEGFVSKRQGARIGYASQDPEFPSMPLEELLLDQPLEGDEIELRTRAQILLGKAQFTDFYQDASLLSGGWKKRLDIVKALMHEPDLLLLDEPTNHLDLEGIIWLEKFLLREKIAYLIVSHDRYFLENVSTKIIELNKCYPQGLFISEGNMSTYMERKEAFLEAQLQQQRGLASVVRNEIEWLRTSPKARTTKSRSRIQRAYEMISELSDVKSRNQTNKVGIDFSASDRETRKLLVGKNLAKAFGGNLLFKGIDVTLSPGTRLGIVGKNGTGKTTFLKLLAGMLPPDTGTIKYADDLKLVYFDQHRERISPTASIREALSPNGDFVNYRGQQIHVNGWAKKFLFSPDRLSLPVSCLSGGERARILIAKLMLEPADLLFLDEPTNDLDIETLEVIEDSLQDFPGAVVLISHDRCLMDRVCTKILGLGGAQQHHFYADYSQWESADKLSGSKKDNLAPSVQSIETKKQKKLSYKEQKELENMEETILNVENEIAKIHLMLSDSAIFANPDKSLELSKKLIETEEKLVYLFSRWEYLQSSI